MKYNLFSDKWLCMASLKPNFKTVRTRGGKETRGGGTFPVTSASPASHVEPTLKNQGCSLVSGCSLNSKHLQYSAPSPILSTNMEDHMIPITQSHPGDSRISSKTFQEYSLFLTTMSSGVSGTHLIDHRTMKS